MAKTTTLNFRFTDEEKEALEKVRSDLASKAPIGVRKPSLTDALKFAIMSSATSSSVSVVLPAPRGKPAKPGD